MRKILYTISAVICLAGCVKDREQSAVVCNSQVKGDTVLYYWNFNTGDSAVKTPSVSLGAGATFKYYSSYIDFTTGSPLNAIAGDDSGMCLRVRNPSDSVIFFMPTTGYDSVTFSFAVRRSNNGPAQNSLLYTVDGTNYISDAIGANVYDIDTLFTRKEYRFACDPKVNNNPKFAIKLTMLNNNTGTSGNDRFDNVMLRAKKR